MRNWGRQVLFCAAVVSGTSLFLSGCGSIREKPASIVETEQSRKEEIQTEAASQIIRIAETEEETQKLITSVDYTSKDGTVRITLPDNTWKVTQDADEMRVFSSGSDAMINIVHASTESSLKTLSIQTTQKDLEAALTRQYSDPEAYDVESFETKTVGEVNIYRYVVKYNAAARMWAYSVTYGIVAKDQAYVITGTVTDDNSTLLKAVEDSVDSFTVLKDEELKSVTGNQIAGTTTDGETHETTAGSESALQLESLQTYGANVTLYTNDTVNVRSGPGTDTDVISGFGSGDAVTVTGETSGWFQVSVGGVTGYVRKDFLVYGQQSTNAADAEQEASQELSAEAQAEVNTASNYDSYATFYTTEGVNIRSQPSKDSSVSGALSGGTAVTVIGETPNWFIVSTGDGTGYVSKDYLTNTEPQGLPADGSYTDGNSNTDSSSSSSGEEYSQISGTVIDSTPSTITIEGDDGNVYTVYSAEASISASDGLYTGLHVSASVHNPSTAEDGTLYATNISD